MTTLAQYQAHARRSDPITSHDAARAISPLLSPIQRDVLRFAAIKGTSGFDDTELQFYFADDGSSHRTRRAELTEEGMIRDTGRKIRYEGDRCHRIIWAITAKGLVENGRRALKDCE